MTMTICPACDRPAHTEDITDGLCPDCRDNAAVHELRAEVKRLTTAIMVAERILSPHIITIPPYPEPDPISEAWVVLAGALGKIG